MNWRSVLLLVRALFNFVTPILAQQFSAGIKAGVQTTSAITFAPITVPFSPLFDHFAFGPEAEIALPRHLGLEFDALHKHYAYGGDVIGQFHGLIGIADTHISYW